MQTGNTLQGTLLSIRGNIEGFSSVVIGFIGAAFWTGIVVGSLYSEKSIERVGLNGMSFSVQTGEAKKPVGFWGPAVELIKGDQPGLEDEEHP